MIHTAADLATFAVAMAMFGFTILELAFASFIIKDAYNI